MKNGTPFIMGIVDVHIHDLTSYIRTPLFYIDFPSLLPCTDSWGSPGAVVLMGPCMEQFIAVNTLHILTERNMSAFTSRASWLCELMCAWLPKLCQNEIAEGFEKCITSPAGATLFWAVVQSLIRERTPYSMQKEVWDTIFNRARKI